MIICDVCKKKIEDYRSEFNRVLVAYVDDAREIRSEAYHDLCAICRAIFIPPEPLPAVCEVDLSCAPILQSLLSCREHPQS